MKKIKIALIGYGYWGPNLLRNFSKLQNVDVKYLCDISKTKLAEATINFPSLKTTTDYNLILNDDQVQAIIIATPIHTHYLMAKDALLSKKHVLVEKPITTTVKEAEELIRIAQNHNLRLMVDHTFVYTPAIRKIKDIIDSGQLGDILYFDSERVNLGLIQNDVNVIWDLAPHDISIINYLFDDKIESIVATGTRHVNKSSEELAHITLQYKSGLVCHIHVSWLSPVKIRRITIGGSKRMILLDDVDPSEKVKIYDKRIDIESNLEKETPFTPIYRGGDITIPLLDQKEALYEEAKHFIECIINEKKPLTDGKEGLEVVRILEATDRSIKERRVINL